MVKLNTILFDLDGTLIDTNEIIIKSFESVFETHFPKNPVTREKILSFIGPTLTQTFSEYTKDPFLIDEMINSYRSYYKKHEFKYFKIYDGVIKTISTLKKKGFNLAIVTSKFKEAAWPSFTHYHLDHYFDVFISLDDITYPKPDKEPILEALSRFKNVNKAIMIGDNHGDILAGKNANIYTAGVAWALKGENYLRQVHPDFILYKMDDIFKIIEKVEEQ